MNHLLASRAVYRRAGRDYREFIFFAFMALSLFLKFYFLEGEVSGRVTRQLISVAASAAFCVLAVALLSLVWRRARLPLSLAFDLLLSLLVLTDVLHMRYYSDLFSFHNIGLSAQVGDVSESVFALFSAKDLLYFTDIPLLYLYYRIFRRISVHPFFRAVTSRRLACAALLLALSSSAIAYRVHSYNKKIRGVLRSMWDRPAVCNNVGAVIYRLADTWNAARDRVNKRTLSEDKVNEAKEWYDAQRASFSVPKGVFGAAVGKNLIVIQVESLQQFVIGLKFLGREVTPNLNEFARSVSFAGSAYNQTSSGNSSDAEFLANAAFYPASAGVAYTRFAGNSYEALPKFLRERGYRAIAMHGDKAGFWNRGHMYPALGFERFVSKKDYSVDEVIGMGLSDKSFFTQSLAMLKNEKQPFYAFLITLSSHYPFNWEALAKRADFSIDGYRGTVVGNYLSAIHYLDREFGEFVKGLKASGLYDGSVVAVYGDHPAIPRWDSPVLSRLLGVDFSKDHNWRYTQRVPLMINVPGVKKLPVSANNSFGVINLPRTLALLLGFDFRYGLGADMFDGAPRPVIFRNGSFMAGDVFVAPQSKSAVNVRSGESADYGEYEEMGEAVKKTLAASDRILEYDLMPRMLEGGKESAR
ncbi:MAG: LTA synthase family protein [Synergistes jonesii]|uniref:LTA synthase family protein n=1 Tax=Synergistes jonesii TaxID=2754 RepID=UPI002A761C3F|nr:LTA synthase family protein [Synergistes jonesii]MDY2984347.1 LTA synthase family protein [Synergistes jonesii]